MKENNLKALHISKHHHNAHAIVSKSQDLLATLESNVIALGNMLLKSSKPCTTNASAKITVDMLKHTR